MADDLRERLRFAVAEAMAHAEADGPPDYLAEDDFDRLARVAVPVVVEHIAAHFDRRGEEANWTAAAFLIAAREIRSTYGQ